MDSAASFTTVNLDSDDITRDDYVARVTALANYLNELSYSQGWCSERFRYFAALTDEFVRDEGILTVHLATIPEVDSGENYNTRLALIRSRTLWYVRAGNVALNHANEGFTVAGIPEYQADKPGHHLSISLPRLFLSIPDNDNSVRISDLTSHLNEFIIARMEGRDYSGPDLEIVPGSIRFTYTYPEDIRTRRSNSAERIDENDTSVPSYRN